MFDQVARGSLVLIASLALRLPCLAGPEIATSAPVVKDQKRGGSDDLQAANVLANLGIKANQQNHFAIAESHLRASRSLLQKINELDTPNGRMVNSSLALSIQRQGRFEEARTIYEGALGEARLHAGEQNLEFAALLSNLAYLNYETGNYQSALQQNRRALEIRRALQNDEESITSLNNLGQCLTTLGKAGEAEPLLLEAITLERKSQNGPYPHLSDGLINLAVLERNSGRVEAARQYLFEALRIVEQFAEPDHPDLAIVWNNLGQVEMTAKNFKEARKRFTDAVSLWGRTLGIADPRYAAMLSNFAALESIEGHHKKAQVLFERAVQIDELRLGASHSQTAMDLANLASELFFAKNYNEAIDLFQRAELTEEKTFGADSLKVAEVYANLAITYQAAKRWDEALCTYRKAINGLEVAAGLDCPRLESILRAYAFTLRKKEQFGEAELAETRALGIQVRNTLKQSSSSGRVPGSVGDMTFR